MSFIKIITPDSSEYRYFPITKSRLRLSIQATHDARISLRTHLGGDSNVYEIIIGGWENTMSVIKRNNQEQDVAEAETRNILGAQQMCNIYIQWFCDGTLNVGHQNGEVFLSYKDRNPFVINYIGVSTVWGATGEFLIEESSCTSTVIRQQLIDTSHFWIDYNESYGLPQNAIMASEDAELQPIMPKFQEERKDIKLTDPEERAQAEEEAVSKTGKGSCQQRTDEFRLKKNDETDKDIMAEIFARLKISELTAIWHLTCYGKVILQ